MRQYSRLSKPSVHLCPARGQFGRADRLRRRLEIVDLCRESGRVAIVKSRARLKASGSTRDPSEGAAKAPHCAERFCQPHWRY